MRLRLLAVGGGGDGDAFSGNAGGSGQVVFTEVGLEKFKIGLVRSCTCWIKSYTTSLRGRGIYTFVVNV